MNFLVGGLPGVSPDPLDTKIVKLRPSYRQHLVGQGVELPHLTGTPQGLDGHTRLAVTRADHPKYAGRVQGTAISLPPARAVASGSRGLKFRCLDRDQ